MPAGRRLAGHPGSDPQRLVESRIAAGAIGCLGEPTVNVLELNLALAGLKG